MLCCFCDGEVTTRVSRAGVTAKAGPREFRVHEPHRYDHVAGKQFITRALAKTAYGKGDWLQAYGLLGATLLQCDFHDRDAYKSLFLSVGYRSKLEAMGVMPITLGAMSADGSGTVPVARPSVIFRRESAIYAIAENLAGRYMFDDSGSYRREYRPAQRRQNDVLLASVQFAVAVLEDLNESNYVDLTLRDIVGVAIASLERDGVYVPLKISMTIGSVQVHRDALDATLLALGKNLEHGQSLFEELQTNMTIRRLETFDTMLLPPPQGAGKHSAHQTLIDIISNDIERIRVARKKAA